MAIKEIGAALDRVARNTINDNFKSQDGRIDNLVLQAGDAHPELQDAHYSGVKGQTFATVGKRFDAVEQQAITDKSTANSELQAGLATKRDKSVMLTQADLSTASETHKITPNHLNQAVKDMMSGTTPVSPNIADYQVSEQKVASGAITLDKIGAKQVQAQHLSYPALPGKISKNLFNKNSVLIGYYVGYQTGNLATNAIYCASDYIEITPNYNYIMHYSQQLAFYDSNKKYVSGLSKEDGTFTFTAPATAKYVRITTLIANLENQMVEVGSVKSTFEPYGAIVDKKTGVAVELPYIVNLTKPVLIDTATKKMKIQKTTYGIIEYTSNNRTEFFGKDVETVFDIADKLDSTHFLFKVILTVQNYEATVRLENYAYLPFQSETVIGTFDKRRPFVLTGNICVNGYNGLDELHFNADEFANLKEASQAIKNINCEDKQKILHLSAKEYDAFAGFTLEELNTDLGLFVDEKTTWQGSGMYDTIIVGRLPDGTSANLMSKASPLHMRSNSIIKDLRVIGKNTRYAIHDDYNTSGVPARNHVLENVSAYKEAGGGLGPAYGAGYTNGARHIFRNCEFVSDSNIAFSLHNGVAQTKGGFITLENVRAIAKNTNNVRAMEFPSAGAKNTDFRDQIRLSGCYSSDKIQFNITPYGTNTSGKIEFDYIITGTTGVVEVVE